MKEINVVIMGQNYSTSLGLIQAAGEAGFRCGVVKSTVNPSSKLTPELKSIYVDKYLIVDRRNEKELLSALIDTFSRQANKVVLIPSDDFSVSFIDRNLSVLEEFFFVPNIHHTEGEMVRFMDKQLQAKQALLSGLATAQNWSIVLDGEDGITIPDSVVYPCITKPQMSVGFPKTFIRKCDTSDELFAVLQEINKTKPCTVLIEEYINVKNEYTIPGVAVGENVIIPALIRKKTIGLGDHRGVTISGEVLNADRFLNPINGMKNLAKAIGIQGIFDIELLESGKGFYFNEINLRYGAAGYALTRAGINLPAMWIYHCLGYVTKKDSNVFRDGLTFVSDKAALDYYGAGFMSWKSYHSLLNSVDFRFLVDNPDVPARNAFRKIVLETIKIRLKHDIKHLLLSSSLNLKRRRDSLSANTLITLTKI